VKRLLGLVDASLHLVALSLDIVDLSLDVAEASFHKSYVAPRIGKRSLNDGGRPIHVVKILRQFAGYYADLKRTLL
jgi:hypothetical protein